MTDAPLRHRDPLEEGAGKGALLFIDAAAGVSGRSLLGALVDLGVPLAVLRRILASAIPGGIGLEAQLVRIGTVGATQVTVKPEGTSLRRGYGAVLEAIERAEVGVAARAFARRVLVRFAGAMAREQGVSLDGVELGVYRSE